MNLRLLVELLGLESRTLAGMGSRVQALWLVGLIGFAVKKSPADRWGCGYPWRGNVLFQYAEDVSPCFELICRICPGGYRHSPETVRRLGQNFLKTEDVFVRQWHVLDGLGLVCTQAPVSWIVHHLHRRELVDKMAALAEHRAYHGVWGYLLPAPFLKPVELIEVRPLKKQKEAAFLAWGHPLARNTAL